MKEYKVRNYTYRVDTYGSGTLRYGSSIDEWIVIPTKVFLELAEIIKEDAIKSEGV